MGWIIHGDLGDFCRIPVLTPQDEKDQNGLLTSESPCNTQIIMTTGSTNIDLEQEHLDDTLSQQTSTSGRSKWPFFFLDPSLVQVPCPVSTISSHRETALRPCRAHRETASVPKRHVRGVGDGLARSSGEGADVGHERHPLRKSDQRPASDDGSISPSRVRVCSSLCTMTFNHA